MRVGALRFVRSQNIQRVLAVAYVGLFAGALRIGPGPGLTACLGAAALLGAIGWTASLRRARAIAELATSRIASAAQGYVELMGRASVDPQHLIFSPMSNVQCVWYRYRLYSKDNSKKEWEEIDSGTSSATFEIRDETGVCNIDPDHAEVIAPEVRTSYPGDNKLVEEFLFGGRMIYVLGEFSTIGGANAALSLREDVSALLASWKQDKTGLHRRFDRNGDGQIDLQEWEEARRQATHSVEQEHRAIRSAPGIHMMRAPQDDRLFLMSPLSPQKLRQRFLRWSWFHLAVGLLAVGVLIRLG